MAQALAGSETAFEQILRRYQRPVINLIARIVGDRAVAEDLAQDTFVKAFRNLAAFDPTRRLSSWLLRIAHNTALDALRRARTRMPERRAHSRADDPSEDVSVPPEPDPVERDALGRALTTALTELRPEYRAAIVLRYEEGLPYDEIGRVLGVTEVTARTHVHRARKELSRRLTDAGWGPAR